MTQPDIMALVVGISLFIILCIAYDLANYYNKKWLFQRRLYNISAHNKMTNKPVKKQYLVALQRENLLQRRFKKYSSSKDIKESFKLTLYKLGVHLPVSYILLIGLALTSVLAFILRYVISFSFINSYILSILIIGGIVYFIVEKKHTKQQQTFVGLLPSALDIIIRALKAGFSIEKAFLTVAHEIPAPVGNEFRIICEQIAFGMLFEDALRNATKRVENPNFDFFIAALIIQRRIGGSLADLIVTITHTLRKREELRNKIKSLSAEAKMTGLIIGCLPFIMTAILTYMNHNYLQSFLNDPLGVKLLYSVGIMMTAAFFAVRHLVKFEV